MKTYILKPGPAFQAVDGPHAGRSYVPGVEYKEDDIPPGDRARFKEVAKPKAKAPARAAAVKAGESASGKAPNETQDKE